MKRILLFLSILAAAPSALYGQADYQRQYDLLAGSRNQEVINGLLDDWERHDPDATDMLVGQFNRYAAKLLSHQTGFSQTIPHGVQKYYPVTDSTGVVSGYLFEYFATDTLALAKAAAYIDRAIGIAPERIDFRMNKISLLWLAGDRYLNEYESELTGLYGLLADRHGTWLFEKAPMTRQQAEVLLQEYSTNLLGLRTEEAYGVAERIAAAELKAFPKSAAAYTTLGSVESLRGNDSAAYKYYRKALRSSPKDLVVLKNLALNTVRRGKTKEALGYLKKIKHLGSADDIAWAERVESRTKSEKQ